MKKCYESPYHIITHHPETNLLEDAWTIETEYMTDEEYKQEMLQYKNEVMKHDELLVLVKLLDFQFPIIPEMQDWVEENIFTFTVLHVQKIAMLMPKNIIANLSVEQINEEKITNEFYQKGRARYFSKEEEALEWLFD